VLSGSEAYTNRSYTGIPSLRFAMPTELPEGPPEADGYPVIGAREALKMLREPTPKPAYGRQRVVVTDLRFGRADFWTDRGLRELPAWILTYRDDTPPNSGVRRSPKNGTAYMLAVAPSARYGPTARDGGGLRVSDDGRTLWVPMNPGRYLSGPCRKIYTTRATETRTAVAFHVKSRRADPAADCPEEFVGYSGKQIVEVRTAYAVGNRVVVWDESGAWPWPVFTCGQDTRGAPTSAEPCPPTQSN
jgi:hypothetical protein